MLRIGFLVVVQGVWIHRNDRISELVFDGEKQPRAAFKSQSHDEKDDDRKCRLNLCASLDRHNVSRVSVETGRYSQPGLIWSSTRKLISVA